MEKANITLAFDQEKLDALEFYLKKDKSTAQRRLEESLAQLYEQTVPEPLREYLESRTTPPPKPRRPTRTDTSKASVIPAAQVKEVGEHE